MDWTVNCFRCKEKVWKEMAEGAEGPGHRAYGWKQTWMWGMWAKTAAASFGLQKGG